MFALLYSELARPLTQPMQILNPIAFLLLSVMLFAIAVPDGMQASIGSAGLWVVVLLTTMLSLDSLFRRAYDDGSLEQIIVAAEVPFIVVLMRLFVHWVYGGLLITLLSPLLGLMLNLPAAALPGLMLSLLCGTPALTLLGGMGAALTVGFSRGGMILALLILPLFVPVLIFGAGAVQAALDGSGTSAQLSWLIFISMLALAIGPMATLAGLKISLQLGS